jgi:hypothetical protein
VSKTENLKNKIMRKFNVEDVNLQFLGVWNLEKEPKPRDLIFLKVRGSIVYFYVYSEDKEEIQDGYLMVEEVEHELFQHHVNLGHIVHYAKKSRR